MIDVVIEGEHYYSPDAKPWKKGGEANVYRFQPRPNFTRTHGPGPFVLKIFKVGQSQAHQKADRDRQAKLRDFPRNLPKESVAMPLALAHDSRTGRVTGYVMALVPDVTPLIELKKFKNKDYRTKKGLTVDRVLRIFANLKQLIQQVHAAGIVIGDFNDKNVLVNSSDEVFLIDADSFQFGTHKCRALVPGFVDPTIVEINTSERKQPLKFKDGRQFSQNTDWYAFNVMLLQTLIGSNPLTGGLCKVIGADGRLLQGNQRIIANVSIFHPDVELSDVAVPLSVLPRNLYSYWERVFSAEALREPFPEKLLDPTAWMMCQCDTIHGRSMCPVCNAQGIIVRHQPSPPPVTAQTGASRHTASIIIAAAYHNGEMRYVTHANGAYYREDDVELCGAPLDPRETALVAGGCTVLAKGSTFAVFGEPNSPYKVETQEVNGKTTVATNSQRIYWMAGDSIVCDTAYGRAQKVADTAANRTSIWVSETFGLAVTQLGLLLRVQTFAVGRAGLTGSYTLASYGKVVDVHCVVGDDYAWLILSSQSPNGNVTKRCFVFNAQAELMAMSEASRANNTWIDSVGSSALAFRGKLIVPVPTLGLVRIGMDSAQLRVEKISSKAQPLLNKEPIVGLYLTTNGLLCVTKTTVLPT